MAVRSQAVRLAEGLAEGVPLPPLELAERAGALDQINPFRNYEEVGRMCRDAILAALPRDWSWEDRSALDFGCGAGRVLRHFLPEADRCAFHGCDIDAPSIAWAEEHLSPPFRLFVSGEAPPLAYPDSSFDLIWAMSVFTHLDGESWAGWLLELRRLLKADGILIASFLSQPAHWLLGEPWDDARIGMNTLKAGEGWENGGPVVFHSEWWLRAHWGRAFEIRSHQPGAIGQGLAVMRPREVSLTREDLERPEPDEPRELSAAIHHARQLYAEAAEQRGIAREQTAALAEVAKDHDRALAELEATRARYAVIAGSRSWRLTAPLRRAGMVIRGHLGRAG